MNLKKTLLATIVSLAFLPTFFAQNQAATDTSTTAEVTVAATKFAESRRNIPNQISTISSREIERVGAINAADLLTSTGEIFVQKSQGGGGSPVLRGFEANRVLLVFDGVRMNNAIYRAGHLQNLLRVDPLALDRAEVVFGPGSLIYGSDAMGGAMAFFTKKSLFSSESSRKVSGNASVQAGFPTSQQLGHLDFTIAGGRFSSLTSISAMQLGDVVQGKKYASAWPTDFGKRTQFWDGFTTAMDSTGAIILTDNAAMNDKPEKQVKSAYSSLFLLQKFRLKTGKSSEHALNFYATTTGDVDRYDRLSEVGTDGKLRWAEWYYGPETWAMANYQFKNRPISGGFYEELTVSAAFQAIEESRQSRRWNATKLKSQVENVAGANLNLDLVSRLGDRNRLRYGLEFWQNKVDSKSTFTDQRNEAVTDADTRYPDGGSTMAVFGIYAADQFSISEKFSATAGLRFNSTNLAADFRNSVVPLPFTEAKQKTSAVVGNLGLVFLPAKSLKISVLGSTGFRNPNVDDMGKVFESVAGTQLIVPNADLKPEYSKNGEIGIETVGDGRFSVDLTGFFTTLNDAIVLRKFKLGGLDSVVYDGKKTPVFAQQNAEKAQVAGVSARLGGRFSSWLRADATLTFTQGRVVENEVKTPLDHVPPALGRARILAKKANWDAEVSVLFNAEKPISEYRLSAEDNERYASADGTPAWQIVNLRGGYEFGKVRLQASVENLFDQFYRPFASGLSGQGRTISAGAKVRF